MNRKQHSGQLKVLYKNVKKNFKIKTLIIQKQYLKLPNKKL